MIKLAVDGRALFDGSEHRGIGIYVSRLLAGLSETSDIRPLVLVSSTTPLPGGVDRVAVRRRAPRRLGELEHDVMLPRDLRRAHPDVVHSPGQHPPRRAPAPWVQTLHDLTPLVFDHRSLESDARRWRRIGPRLRHAAAVIAVSRYSADQGMRFFGLDASRVHVVHQGVDQAFCPAPHRTEVTPPYFLHVGAWGPHKGLAEAMETIAQLADAGHPHRLKVVGSGDAWMAARVAETAQAARRPDRIDLVGYVDDIVQLYQHATALLMTSRAEGFGLPAVEAMACGTPVIAFANSSLVEVVGEGGILVDDGSVAAVVDAARSLIDDPGAWIDWADRARRRGAAFSWDRTVAQHAEIFRAVAQRTARS